MIFASAYLHIVNFLFIVFADSTTDNQKYLAQDPPGRTPELFAPNLVNTDSVELNAVFNSTFTEFFFTRIINGSFIIHHAERKGGVWSNPEPIYMFENREVISTAVDMTLTQDGNTMYFLGIYSEDESGSQTPDIYSSKKVNGKWQVAKRLPEPFSTNEYMELYPVVVGDGSLYFVSDRPGGYGKRDIYRAQALEDGKFDAPVSLGSTVNSREGSGDTYVAADESYLVFTSTRDTINGMFAAFKKNGKWEEPVYLGKPINTEWTDFCPYMSPDEKYFFFSRRYSDPPESGWEGVTKGEIYWMDSQVIFDLK